MDKSVPRVTVWHHSVEPHDDKTMALGKDLSIRTSHSCQILIFYTQNLLYLSKLVRVVQDRKPRSQILSCRVLILFNTSTCMCFFIFAVFKVK